jgi:hypothetical protein
VNEQKNAYLAKLQLKNGKRLHAYYNKNGLKLVGHLETPQNLGEFRKWAQKQDFELIEVIDL